MIKNILMLVILVLTQYNTQAQSFSDYEQYQKEHMSTIIINGTTYNGSNITIINNKVIIDGKDQTPDSKEITITVDGNISELSVDYAKEVRVTGNVDKLTTTSGDVTCNNVTNGVKTTSGDVECNDITGDVVTTSGDVKAKNISGGVKTISGDIKR